MQSGSAHQVTMADVAREAGVARTTASGILNGQSQCRASPGTRQRVLTAAERLGYRPNPLAQALRGGASRTVGLIGAGMREEIGARRAGAFELAAREHGYMTFAAVGPVQPESENGLVETMLQRRIDGLAMTPHAQDGHRALRALAEQAFPIVTINGNLEQGLVDNVAVDHQLGGRIQAAHLLEVGCRRLCVITVQPAAYSITTRLDAATRRITEHGVKPPQLLCVPRQPLSADMHKTVTLIRDFLENNRRLDGIIAANDLIAQLALRAAMESGWRVPDDIALIGYDDSRFAQSSFVPLTTVRQPAEDLGRLAFERLHYRLQHRVFSDVEDIFLSPSLVVRSSTASSGSTEVSAKTSVVNPDRL